MKEDSAEYITKEKRSELLEELDHLKRVRRKEVAENLEYAKSLGDLSENAEYHEARDIQAAVEDRISHLESILKTAKIVSGHHTDKVAVGSNIKIRHESKDLEHIYTIVGAEESDIGNGKISVKSPLGQAALGKKKGEAFTVSTPSGPATYKIVDIK